MNKKIYLLILFFALILSVPQKVQAQVNSDWQLIGLTPGGYNVLDGVEALFQTNVCDGRDVIYIKFINRNTYSVKVEWADAVFTEQLKWINKDNVADKKIVTIPANGEVKGECSNSTIEVLKKSGNEHMELVIEMKNFVANKKDFKLYSASNFKVIAVK